MRSTVIDVSRYGFSKDDQVLVDANVWLYLFGPPSALRTAATVTYSKVFKDVQTAGTALFLDVLVLSEFVNRFARLEYDVLKNSGAPVSGNFKIFRDSADFKSISEAIRVSVMKIGRFARPVDHELTSVDLPALFDEFADSARDINDELLAAACKRHSLAFLTHDGDLGHAGIKIFTANSRLLGRS